ncbi:MAG: methyltransferase type 11, partial [Lachnospiraceae bacterium]|nr:methyltransferase type 11 [Lachnospiraceae bacterium]
DDIIKWIDQPSIVPFIECIPDTLKSTFRKEVIEEMLDRALQPDGTCFETFRRLQVYAQK